MEGQRAVKGVALAPAGPVEHHRGQKEQQAEAHQGPDAVRRAEAPDQPQPAPGQHDIEEDGKELDEIQVGHRQVRDGGQKIEIGRVVVADRQAYRGKTAVFPESLRPLGQERLVVRRHIVQQQGAQEECQADGQQGGEQPSGREAPERRRNGGAGGYGRQQKKYGTPCPGGAAGQTKNRDQAEQEQSQPGPGTEEGAQRRTGRKRLGRHPFTSLTIT